MILRAALDEGIVVKGLEPFERRGNGRNGLEDIVTVSCGHKQGLEHMGVVCAEECVRTRASNAVVHAWALELVLALNVTSLPLSSGVGGSCIIPSAGLAESSGLALGRLRATTLRSKLETVHRVALVSGAGTETETEGERSLDAS